MLRKICRKNRSPVFRIWTLWAALAFSISLFFGSVAWCEQDAQEMLLKAQYRSDVQDLIGLLLEKGLISSQEADGFLDRLSQVNVPQADQTTPRWQSPFNEQDFQELNGIVEEIRSRMDKTVDDLLQRDRLAERRFEELERKVLDNIAVRQQQSSWAERITFSGDLRLRYQAEFWDDANAETIDFGNYPDTIDTTIDRERYRYRARMGIKAKLVDPRVTNIGKVTAGLWIATGNANDPVSTNTTMGDAFNKDSFALDRAYADYAWSPMEEKSGRLPEIKFTGGRMPNPFFSTNLVWDSDLNFEGVAFQYTTDTLTGNSWRSFFTAGAFPLQEMQLQSQDKWLYGGQAGLEHRPFWGLNYTLAVSFYYFQNITGAPIGDITDTEKDGWDWSVPQYRQKGNSLVAINPFYDSSHGYDEWKWGLASDFKELNVTAMIDIDRFYPVHIMLWGDYVINLGYNRDDVDDLAEISSVSATGDKEQTRGYMYGLTLGYPQVRNWGEWSVSFFYKYLEADAVVDAFTDSDFHGGGTDAQGYTLNFQFGLYKNVWLSCSYLSADEIFRDEEAVGATQLSVDVFQFDISFMF